MQARSPAIHHTSSFKKRRSRRSQLPHKMVLCQSFRSLQARRAFSNRRVTLQEFFHWVQLLFQRPSLFQLAAEYAFLFNCVGMKRCAVAGLFSGHGVNEVATSLSFSGEL